MIQARDAKKNLRAQLRARRSDLSQDEIVSKSRAIASFVINADEFRDANIVALYRACFGEVDTDKIFYAARSAGKRVLYPHTDAQKHALEFRVVNELEEMISGAWGIPEPPDTAEVMPLEKANLVILPGVAFDRKGGRLGMGGGFYDRILGNLPKTALKMGAAYDFQVLDFIPLDENDERIDCLVTETGVMRFVGKG